MSVREVVQIFVAVTGGKQRERDAVRVAYSAVVEQKQLFWGFGLLKDTQPGFAYGISAVLDRYMLDNPDTDFASHPIFEIISSKTGYWDMCKHPENRDLGLTKTAKPVDELEIWGHLGALKYGLDISPPRSPRNQEEAQSLRATKKASERYLGIGSTKAQPKDKLGMHYEGLEVPLPTGWCR